MSIGGIELTDIVFYARVLECIFNGHLYLYSALIKKARYIWEKIREIIYCRSSCLASHTSISFSVHDTWPLLGGRS